MRADPFYTIGSQDLIVIGQLSVIRDGLNQLEIDQGFGTPKTTSHSR
jgi:hypothetical protein